METRRAELSQVLYRISNSARERAPIAAEFEDCTQRFDMLSSVMESNEIAWEPYQIILDDYRSRLATWGNDTGAKPRTIDHILRKSSKLRTQALELLEHLHETLQNILDLVEMAATPMLAPPVKDSTAQGYFDVRTTEDRLDSGLVPEHRIRPLIESIAGIFNCLISLVPTLQDPVSWEDYGEDDSGENVQKEIESARRMFAKAPLAIVERLGTANWKRKRYLQQLRNRTTSTPPKTGPLTSIRIPKRDFQLPTNPPARKSRAEAFAVQKSENRNTPNRISPSRTTSTTISTDSTTFSNQRRSVKTYSVGETSVAETEEPRKLEPVRERYLVPKAPVILEPNKTFLCPYCSHEVTVGDQKPSEGEWADHVFTDLEPYVCTWEHCPRELKTYGSKEDWFQHELNAHRIPKVYTCQTCDLEYTKQEDLEQHLGEIHGNNLSPEELAIIASMCERFSQKTSENQACHLCGELTSSTKVLRDHVADHLEQFALTSVKSEDGFEEDPPLSQFSDSGSERRFRLRLGGLEDLGLLVEEKTEPILQQISLQVPTVEYEPGSAIRSAMRPSIGKRGDSYTFMSRVKQHLDMQSALNMTSKKSSQIDSMNVALDQTSDLTQPPHTIRTGLPPRKVEFEGRIQDLKELYTQLSTPGRTCVLSGTGGIGKSALAAEYTYRFESEYSYIFWVQAETPIVCADAYSQISSRVVLRDGPGSHDQERLIMLSREFLEKATERWLLVFDNVDEWLDLKQFLPVNFAATSGSILITTQRVDLIEMTNWSNISQVTLDGLSLDESRRLLLRHTQPGLDSTNIRSHPEFKLAGDIAKLAERLPLALSLIAGYILVSRCSLEDFVVLWNERRKHMQRNGEASSSLTDAALETAWNLGLREVPGDARDILNILAFLDPDNSQKEMLVDEHEDPILEMLHSTEAGRIKRMVAQLSERKLITIETRSGEEVWSIHRSLQAKILQDLNRDPQKRERVYTQAFLLVRKRFPLPSPIQVPEPSKWPACRRYLPHVLSLRKIFTGPILTIIPSVRLAQLFSDGGIGLWERGMTNEGLDLLKSAESILDQLGSHEDLLRANIHVIISLLLQDSDLSHLAECKTRIRTALDIRKEYHSKVAPELYTKNDEILLYNAWSDYACVLLQYNNFQEAEPIFTSCYEKYMTWGPGIEIPYEYAKYYHHMAFCLMYQRKFAEAIDLAEQGLHWVTIATGQSAAHNRWKFDLACIVLQSGDLIRGLKLHEEILDSRNEQHGSSAFLTLQSWYAVGAAQAYLGKLSDAEASMRQILDLDTSREGFCPEAVIARTKFHLAKILQDQKASPEEAEELFESSRRTLRVLIETQSLDALKDVKDEHELALFDHLQPVFDGRFIGRDILRYLT